MSNYFYDHSCTDAIIKFFKKKRFKRLYSPSDISGKSLCEGSMVFVHADYYDSWVETASENLNVHFVFMSRTGKVKKGRNWPDNIHICGFKADQLQQYERVNNFFEELAREEIQFDLLTPSKSASHLIALYILCQGYLAANGAIKLPDGVGDVVKSNKKRTWGKDWWAPVCKDKKGEMSDGMKGETESLNEKKLKENIMTLFKNIEGLKGKNVDGNFTASVNNVFKELKSHFNNA